MPEPARVLIVDDSRIFRAALAEALAGAEGVVVVGSVFSGEKALEFLRSTPADVATLDVEMPGLDGLQTLAEIQRLNATRPPAAEIGVLMVSAFTRRGAEVTVRALQAGAFDFVTKPSGPSADANLTELRRQLAARIRLFMARRRVESDAPASGRRELAETRHPPAHAGRSPRLVRAVLIASSTGGPRALDALLPDLRRRIALPILIVQHMPPPFTGSLAESLSRRVGAPVVEAADGAPVRPETVYIAPGGRHLVLRRQGGQLQAGLNDQPPENHCRPSADVLFRSAAAALGGEAVAVVLTGMDCDGTAGLRPLKRAGAYVIAQDEATSVVWGMPGNVVRAGLADEVLPLGEIAAAVQALVGERGRPDMELSSAVFDELRRLIHQLCELVVGEDKAYLIRHRLAPVARAAGCRSFKELAQKLRGPQGEALHAPVVEAITTAETSFFRDGHSFEAFRAHLLPQLGERARGGAKVRLWCAAAATGQEPYSLAMLLADCIQANRGLGLRESDFSILATDISEKVLATARAASYSDRDAARGLTPALLARHFERRGGAWVVREPVRRLVEFRRHNLTETPTDLTPFDAIFCRNLLIYFDLDTRQRVCRQLHALLRDGGWLVLGAAENLYGVSDAFETLRFGDALAFRKSAHRGRGDLALTEKPR